MSNMQVGSTPGPLVRRRVRGRRPRHEEGAVSLVRASVKTRRAAQHGGPPQSVGIDVDPGQERAFLCYRFATVEFAILEFKITLAFYIQAL
jgi:hypothetical protein